MTRKTRLGLIGLLSALAPTTTLAQAPPAAAKVEPARPPGKRVTVRFVEVRERDGSSHAGRPCSITLHADAKAARVFVGTQVALRARDGGVTTTTFKNAGLEVEATVEGLSDGRFKVRASYELGGVVGGSGGATSGDGNPVLSLLRGNARVVVREGETVPFASAVDPVTGDRVRVDLTVAEAAPGRMQAAGAGDGRRLRATVVLTRRQGDRLVARRPYAVVVPADADEGAEVFSGSMLPVQVTYEGRPTVMLKDVGAGLRLTAHRGADGRTLLDLSFSDGTLAASPSGPVVRTFQSDSQLVVNEGETVVVAAAVDPETGETVEAEVTVSAAP